MKRWKPLLLCFFPLVGLLLPEPAMTGAELDEIKYVALTFDDGPWQDTTEELLDGLKRRNAHATFFLIGEQISECCDTVLRMAEEGHQIGNHTYSHARLDRSVSQGMQELNKTELLLSMLLGEGDYWIRPPWGYVSEELCGRVREPMVYWSIDTEDWRSKDADRIVQTAEKSVRSGDIILLHDPYPTSVSAALRIIDDLSAQGYRFVTVKELFEKMNETADPGRLYARPGQCR